MTKELVDTGSPVAGSDTHHKLLSSPTPTIAHSNLDDFIKDNDNDDLTSINNTSCYTLHRSIDQVQGQADKVAARLRKAEMCAAAAAMISAAAKASKRRQRNIHKENNTAALGRDLIHRVDTQTILTSVDRIIAPLSSSTRITSIDDNDDDHVKTHQPSSSSYPSSPTSSSEPTTSDYDMFDNNVDEIDTTSPPPEPEPNNNGGRKPTSNDENPVSLASRIPFKRKAAVRELIATEQSYCKDLDQLVHYFLATIQKADCISDSKKHDLVRNASDVLQFQRGFATALEAASETPVAEHGSVDRRVIAICECFCEWADQFSVYIPYCIYHDRATDVLNHLRATNHRFVTLLDKMHAHTRARDDRRTFQDYLIMPVQRLLKYKLILETIAKTIQPYDEEYDIMNRSLQVMHHVASRINSEKSSLETKRKTRLFNDRVDWHSIVGASDQFVKELGDCTVIGTLDVRILHVKVDKVKRLGCALYPTYMVICTAKRQNKYTPQHWFPLSLLELEDIPDEHPNANYAWLLRSDNRVFQFFAMSEQEKRLWIDALQNAIQSSRELYNESITTTTTASTLVADRPTTPSQQLAELSLHNLPTQSSAPSSPTQSSTNKVLRSSTTPSLSSTTHHHRHHHHFPSSLFSRPHAHHTTTPPPSPISTVSPMRACCTMPEISQDVSGTSSSNSRHRSFSQATFRDILSSTMADIRAHRRCSHYYDHCAQMDKRFADVSYVSVLVARTQASSERNSIIEQRKKYKSRMAKSISMVALNTLLPAHPHCTRSRPQSPTTPTTPTLPFTPTTASSLNEEIKEDDEKSPDGDLMRRKSSLPDRLPSTTTTTQQDELISSSSSE